MKSSRRSLPLPATRPVISPTVEKLLLEIEGQALKTQPKNATLPKDYAKENFRRLKEIQDNRKKEGLTLQTPTKVFPLQVPNRIQPTNKSNDNCRTAIQPKGLSAISCGKSDSLATSRSEKLLRRSQSHQSILPIVEPKIVPHKSSIAQNKSFQAELAKPQLPHTLGTVPKYLIARKQKWKEEADEKRKAASNAQLGIPPGHTLMSDEERLATLELLEKTREELLQKLISLPVRLDTIRSRNLKDELEAQLTKAEEGIRIFSRTRVLIKNDE